VDQVAGLTHTKRTEVVENALAVYHGFVRQAVTGARVVAREATGEETELATPELAALESKSYRLSPEELGLPAKKLAAAKDPKEAARVRQRIARGFYGI
jgi:anthranilate phosphoribosyltransferase